MSDNLELTAAITTEEPEVAATLDELRWLVLQGMAGKSPRVSTETGNWEVYDNEIKDWTDTGISASGDVSPEQLAQAIEDYFDEHPIDVPTDAVLYTPQTLTPAQQEQARGNIGIEFMTAADIDEMWGSIDGLPDGDEVSY